ncbi:MAG: helix-turn-helix domain-containing protein [Lachnospiraceae bacterium]|nr:helix-turn-helix domain-containing protein [Lachnospiraceae bacterium]
MDGEKLDIAALIPFGRANAVSQAHLASITGLHPRTVRQLIQLARLDGAPIVSSPRDGYWRAESLEDIERYVLRESRRVAEITAAFEGVMNGWSGD